MTDLLEEGSVIKRLTVLEVSQQQLVTSVNVLTSQISDAKDAIATLTEANYKWMQECVNLSTRLGSAESQIRHLKEIDHELNEVKNNCAGYRPLREWGTKVHSSGVLSDHVLARGFIGVTTADSDRVVMMWKIMCFIGGAVAMEVIKSVSNLLEH